MSNGENERQNLQDRAPDPGAESPAEPDGSIVVAGLWDGSTRLYLTPDHTSFVEFQLEGVESFGEVAPGSAPLLGEQGTWIRFRSDAQLEFVRMRSSSQDDEFAIEFRARSSAGGISDFWRKWTGIFCTWRHYESPWPWPEPWPPWPPEQSPYPRFDR